MRLGKKNLRCPDSEDSALSPFEGKVAWHAYQFSGWAKTWVMTGFHVLTSYRDHLWWILVTDHAC